LDLLKSVITTIALFIPTINAGMNESGFIADF
jgi:hypothetical protein